MIKVIYRKTVYSKVVMWTTSTRLQSNPDRQTAGSVITEMGIIMLKSIYRKMVYSKTTMIEVIYRKTVYSKRQPANGYNGMIKILVKVRRHKHGRKQDASW